MTEYERRVDEFLESYSKCKACRCQFDSQEEFMQCMRDIVEEMGGLDAVLMQVALKKASRRGDSIEMCSAVMTKVVRRNVHG